MKYYLHRISNHIDWSHPLLEQKNLLSIGWVDIAAKLEHFISEHQNDWAKVPATVADYCEKEWGSIPRSRFGLQRFLEMEQGDWIVVPTWRAFHIYEIVSDERLVPNLIENDLKDFKNWNGISPIIKDGSIRPENEENTELDLGFFRQVKAIERDIDRGDYANASLTSRLKSRQTNLDISDLEESIKRALNQYKEKRPINLRNELKKKLAPELQKTVLEMKGPDQFENLIERYFEQNGASVLRPAKNEPDKEGDADIIATFESLNLMVYVQAKRHDKDTETDTMAVNQIKQYVEYKSNNDDEYSNLLWVISTADKFTGDCINEARKSNVRLINGEEFSQMLLDTGIKHL